MESAISTLALIQIMVCELYMRSTAPPLFILYILLIGFLDGADPQSAENAIFDIYKPLTNILCSPYLRFLCCP
jgi:hypothetical protein